jgi:hypothetical protein
MLIFYSAGSDPMVLDSVDGLNALHKTLVAFLSSPERVIRLDADRSGSAKPYDELLAGLEFEKSEGPIHVSFTADRWLRAEGGKDNLSVYVEFFAFADDEDGNHHHPEYVMKEDYIHPGTMSVIIEADSDWVEERRRES